MARTAHHQLSGRDLSGALVRVVTGREGGQDGQAVEHLLVMLPHAQQELVVQALEVLPQQAPQLNFRFILMQTHFFF